MTGNPDYALRWLDAAEWDKLRPIYESQGDNLPASEQNRVVVVETGNRIIGLCGLNLVAHVGPLWVDEDFRRQQIGTRLAAAAGELVRDLGGKGYLMFPSNAVSAKVAEKLGLEAMAWQVYRREF